MSSDQIYVRDLKKPGRTPFRVSSRFWELQKDSGRFEIVGEGDSDIKAVVPPKKKAGSVAAANSSKAEQILNGSASEVIAAIEAESLPVSLQLLKDKEEAEKKRKTVLRAITQKLTSSIEQG